MGPSSSLSSLLSSYISSHHKSVQVIHFEIPNTSEIFVHRSGRTGRAGKKGTAILIFTESQRRAVRLIERDLSCKFEEV